MADSRVLIEIISTAKGLKVVAKDTEKLAKNVDKVDKAQSKADRSGNKYHKQQKAIHQSNLSSAKGFSKMNETMGSGGSSGLVGAYATLAANVFAATAAFNALRQAAQVETLVEGFTFLADTAGRTSTIISNLLDILLYFLFKVAEYHMDIPNATIIILLVVIYFRVFLSCIFIIIRKYIFHVYTITHHLITFS